jgi:pimeloyl-ACP methyl ester carboxylesterase
MDRAPVNGIELEYEVRGSGEPVVLMHAGVCADFFVPLIEQAALASQHTLVRYHRTGYAGSGRLPGAVSFAQQAAHCRELMRHLGIERAHVVGHSSSASMALQLALDAPEAVGSLALLDPARPAAPTPVHEAMVRTIAAPALERYHAGDKPGAVDTWMRGLCGPDYRAALERALPGAVDQAIADADTFFEQELPAVMQWSFGREDAARITQPALAVLGENSHPVFRERHDLLLAWLPSAEPFVLPGATHLLQVEQPGAMAEALVVFFSRHPLG